MEIELKLSYLFSQFQGCYDFRRLRGWLKLEWIFRIDIKQVFKVIGFVYQTIIGIHWLIMKSRILHLKCKFWDFYEGLYGICLSSFWSVFLKKLINPSWNPWNTVKNLVWYFIWVLGWQYFRSRLVLMKATGINVEFV